jgi:hypothetical protein
MENEQPPNIKIAEAYSSEGNIGAQFTFVNNVLVRTDYFKIEDGKRFPCAPPEKCNKYSITIDLDHPEKHLTLDIKDSETGEITSKLDLGKRIIPVDGVNLMIRAADEKQWENVIAPVEKMSEESKEKFKAFFNYTEPQGARPQNTHIDLVAKAVEGILSEQENPPPIPSVFFKNINQSDEFGIERFIFDRMYHLPDLIEGIELSHLGALKYVAQSEKRDSSGNSIKFEHRFLASSDEEAEKLFTNIATKQAGKWQKIFLACWSLGNEKGQFIYSCSLAELMQKVFPERTAYFGGNEKAEFYGDLKSLEQTRFVFSKLIKKPKRKKDPMLSYNLPLIAVTHELREDSGDKYPERLTISLRPFDPEPHEEKIYHVGAAVKKRTLELHADDTQLASWVQSRKAQNQDKTHISIGRDFLVKLAGLQKTNSSNKTVANKSLLTKLNRLAEKGILIEPPTQIEDTVRLRVR